MRIVSFFFCLILSAFCAAAPAGTLAEVKEMKIARHTDKVDLVVRYPVLGLKEVDADLALWAENTALSFEQEHAESGEELPPGSKSSLDVSYSVERPSDRVVSVVFEAASFTGGVHGALDIIVRNYDSQSGLFLSLPYLFEDVETALNLMATYSYQQLSGKLGAEKVEEMLRGGTSPDADNFSALALRSGGIRIYFQPYQVAPWSAGPQSVDMPLESLAEAHPEMGWWGGGN